MYTNHADSSETYRVPFGVHYVEEGFESFTLDRQSMTSDRNNLNNGFFYPYVFADFTLKSHMRYINIVLADAATGKDLGLVGQFDGVGRDEGVPYGVAAFMGIYYPLTNDSNNPISTKAVLAKEGHYKLKMIGYDDAGIQNPTVDNAPKAVKQYKGKTLSDIKSELGIQ